MICMNCGTKIYEGARFCPKCGNILENIAPEDAVAARERLARFEAERSKALHVERQRLQREGYSEPSDFGFVGKTTPIAQHIDAVSPVVGNAFDLEMENKRAAEANLKEAKAAYKSARKAAGKSSAPKAIAIIALLIAVGIGGGVGWWLSGNQGQPFSEASVQLAENTSSSAPSHSPAEQSGIVTSSASADMSGSSAGAQSEGAPTSDGATLDLNSNASSSVANSSDSDSGSPQAAQGGIQSYVGLWEGSMRETNSGAGSRNCYGAENHPLKLEIKEISPTGKLVADVEMLHHGHSFITQDVSSSEGDEYIKIEGLVGTLEQDGSFVLEESNETHDVKIQFKTEDNQDGSRTLLANACSNGIAFNYFEDTYSLSKQA